MKNLTLDEKIALCEEYTQLWANFFSFFGEGFEGRRVTGEAEAEFFRIMTELARKQFRVACLLGDDFKGADQVMSILNNAVSLNNLQSLTEANLSKYHQEWHVVFIALNKCLGRLLEKRPLPKPGKAPKKKDLPAEAANAESK